MEDQERFPRIVSLAAHDLRTPLATVYGFARTLSRGGELDERSARFVEMIEAAAEQMTDLLDQIGVLARIEGGRYEPTLAEADTLELASCDDPRVDATGEGARVETDVPAVKRALEAFAIAAARHGAVEQVTWTVRGHDLELAPVTPDAAPIVVADDVRDLGSIVARRLVEELGGRVEVNGNTLHVSLQA
jgi:signal transduction histidine kinase